MGIVIVPAVVAGLVFIAHYRALFPDALANRLYWSNVGELMRADTTNPDLLSALCPQAVAVLAWLGLLLKRARRPVSRVNLVLGVCLVFSLACDVQGFQHVRSANLSAIFSCLVAGACLGQWPWKALINEDRRACVRSGLFIIVACLATAHADGRRSALALIGREIDRQCRFGPVASADISRHLPPWSIIMTDEVAGSGSTDLVMRTDMRTLAGGYHRNVEGIGDSIRAYYSPDWTSMRSTIVARHITAVSFCRSGLVSKEANTTYRLLAERGAPGWLRKASFGHSGAEELYLVDWNVLDRQTGKSTQTR